jgi:hypothetical protein
MNEAYEKVYGHKPDEAFLEFTFGGHAEAYKDRAWLGAKKKSPGDKEPPPWADFANINPAFVRQAADVTAFKVKRLQPGGVKAVAPGALGGKHGDKQVRRSALEPGQDELASMPAYSRLLEQSRGLLKDFDTKLLGAVADTQAFGNEAGQIIKVNPSSPLGKASPAAQKHFLEVRTVLNDFASGRIGPTQAERQLQVLTGGQGIIEVPEQMRVLLTGYKQ